MSPLYPESLSRRGLLRQTALGFGSIALASLLAEEAWASDPLAARPAHFKARAQRVLFLFMKGGPSHVDTFDPKPLLDRDHGKPYPGQKPRVQFAQTGTLLRSPRKFRKHGQSGIELSELFHTVSPRAADP